MKTLFILFILFFTTPNVWAYSIQGQIAEDKILLLINNGAEIWLRWDFPNTKDSDRYFQIENCEFPPDIVTLNEMMRHRWDYKAPAGLTKSVSKDEFLAFRYKLRNESSCYLRHVYCF